MLDLITPNRLPDSVLHPATGCDYFARNHRELTDSEIKNIESRYGVHESPRILSALEIATNHTVHHAHNIEMDNTSKTLLATSDPTDNAEQYREVVANLDRIPEFLKFFGSISANIFDRYDKELAHEGRAYGKVALGLLLTIQRGDWESTKLLDATFRGLKDRLPDPESIGYKEYNSPRDRRSTYRYLSLPSDQDDVVDMSDFGIINRRRRVANVYGVGIFKQSKGLVVLSELNEKDRRLALSNPYGVENRSGVASAIGRQFEEDIKGEPGTSRAIIPVSAHYLMLAQRNSEA